MVIETLDHLAALLDAPLLDRSPTSFHWIISIWLGCLGGCVGSFLNVVIYRLPRGISITHPRSRCPGCGHSIRWYDNLPILSWFLLRGRCRDCGTRFSFRYAAVETLLASGFFMLAWYELFSHGHNVPGETQDLDHALLNPQLPWSLYTYHLLLWTTLVAAALIQLDRFPVPNRLWIPAIIVGYSAPLLLTELHPLEPLGFTSHDWLRAPLNLAHGTLAGAGIGSLLAWSVGRVEEPAGQRRALVVATLLCGVFLGWQTAIGLGLAIGILMVTTATLGYLLGHRWSMLRILWLAVVTLPVLLSWKHWIQLLE